MACTDGGVPYPPTRKEVLDDLTPVFLCGIMRALEGTGIPTTVDRVLRHVNWEKAGVSRADFEEWWKLHRTADDEREAGEQARAAQESLAAAALKKLTKAERKALGLK